MKTNKTIAAIALLALLFGAETAFAAWTGPSSAPPGGNAESPINIGGVEQTKSGVFRAYGMRSFVDIIADEDAYADAFFYNSDKKLKTDIKPLAGSLSKILNLQGVSFSWKEGGDKNVGLVAQDVEQVYPELVVTNPSTGLKSVEYGNLVAPLIEAIKEQQKQIDELRREIEALKK